MNAVTTRRPSDTLWIAVAALVAGEVVVIGSALADGIRYCLGGLLAVALIGLVFQLGRTRPGRK